MSNLKVELKQEAFMKALSEKGMSIPDFANQAGISFTTVYRIINGERKQPGATFIAATLKLFNTSNMKDFFLF